MIHTNEMITQKNIELANNHPELVKYAEVETKLLVTNPEAFLQYRDQAVTIEQYYLSSPEDEFSLRVRKSYLPDGPKYSAELKDRGRINNGALKRTEISVPDLSEAAFEYYARHSLTTPLMQHRAYITPEMSVDFTALGTYVEIETPDTARRDELLTMLDGVAIDVTETGLADKEYIAYSLNSPEERKPSESLDSFTDRVAREIVAHYVSGKNQVVVGLTGMSGSGKTSVTNLIKQKLTKEFGEAFNPVVLSTDDYHRGKAKLEEMSGGPWTNWDHPLTYDTESLARDLRQLSEGHTIYGRHFDFETEEPVADQAITPSPFVIVEGLYAGSSDLIEVRDLHFELPTSIATSIGRDVRRLIIENRANRAFPTAESRLKYQLEDALPLYLEQERPTRNSFCASSRPMAERAFMLEQIRLSQSANAATGIGRDMRHIIAMNRAKR